MKVDKRLLGKNVVCKGYLQKKETKHVYCSDINDEYIENENSITLNQGGSCEQNIYRLVEKKFKGICVGIFFKNIKREYIDCVNDGDYGKEEQFISTHLKEAIQVVKVYYANNKSRLVPVNMVQINE